MKNGMSVPLLVAFAIIVKNICSGGPRTWFCGTCMTWKK